jgi:tetratricopeptide (TPR) repeat protein
LDPSEEAIAFARAYAPSVRVIEGTLDAIGPNERFDAATVIDVLGLVDSPVALLREALAHVGADGTVVLAEPRSTVEGHLVFPARRAFTLESLEAIAVRAALEPAPASAAPAEFVMLVTRPLADTRAAEALALADDRALEAERALDAVSRALETVANPIEARELLLAFGDIHLRLRDVDSAAGTFVGALRLAPRSARGLVGLGAVAERVGREADALRLYEKAVASDPLEPSAWQALGALQSTRGDTTRARASFGHAMRLAPADESRVAALELVAPDSPELPEARARIERYRALPM